MMQSTISDSSQIKQFTHEDETNVLTVTFRNGSKYEYVDVTQEEYATFRDAESHGKHLNAEIKPNKPCTKIS